MRARKHSSASINVWLFRVIIANVEYPFPPVGIVGAADGKNRRAFLCLRVGLVQTLPANDLREVRDKLFRQDLQNHCV